MEGERLVSQGVTAVKQDKNQNSVKKVEALILQHQPDVMVLEDTSAEGSRRSQRIRELSPQLLALSLKLGIPVAWFTRTQVMKFFFGKKGKGTQQEIAQLIGKRFPEELGTLVPPKRRAWVSQHYQIDMFHAVALALMLLGKRQEDDRSEPGLR